MQLANEEALAGYNAHCSSDGLGYSLWPVMRNVNQPRLWLALPIILSGY